mgnify:CR=1 FL=1
MKKNIVIFIIGFFISSCEPDDICLTSIPDTPKLIIGFYDMSSGLKKEVENLKIQGFDKLKYYPKAIDRFYPAIGNAINVKVVSKIAKNLFN